VLNALRSDQAIGDSSYVRGSSPHHEHFQAIVVIQMHVEGRNDGVEVFVLKVGKPFLDLRAMVVVNQRNRSNHLAVSEFPVMLNQLTTDHFTNRERSVLIAFLSDHPIEFLKQQWIQRNPEPGDLVSFHTTNIRRAFLPVKDSDTERASDPQDH
jgi:hypothetical protein